MTKLEKEIRMMLTPAEEALLDRYLGTTKTRDGAIASLVASTLRNYEKRDLIDLFN